MRPWCNQVARQAPDVVKKPVSRGSNPCGLISVFGEDMGIVVVRLGHRLPRDERITTHVALVSRAFGADGILYSGQQDVGLEKSVCRVAERWGGNFFIEYCPNVVSKLKKERKEALIIHLTMYGVEVDDVVSKLRDSMKEHSRVYVVVGGEKVPPEVYDIAHYNVAVTNQPHSEVAALAICLDRLVKRDKTSFENAKIEIIPTERGKKVVKK